MSASNPARSQSVHQPGSSMKTMAPSATSLAMNADLLVNLPHKPSSALKKEGWSGVMREVNNGGVLIVTHHNRPQAVLLSVERYQALERLAQRERIRGVQQLAELSASFDRRLASLKAPQAHRAFNAFMDEPIELGGKLDAGAD